MSMVDRLLQQLDQRGLRVEPGGPGELRLCGATGNATPEIVRAVKAFRRELADRFAKREVMPDGSAPPAREPEPEPEAEPDPESERCRVCGRDVTDPEDRARLADPAFCDRGGARAVTDGNGNRHEGGERCPYK